MKAPVSWLADLVGIPVAPDVLARDLHMAGFEVASLEDGVIDFEITANRALQRSSDQPVVDIWGMLARFGLSQGPVTVAANEGRYNLDEQKVDVPGPVRVAGPEGESLLTQNVTVDLKQNLVTSKGGVSGRTELGQFQANRMQADLNGRTVVLDGGARLKIVQGAVR